MRNAFVLAAQQRLAELGYWVGTPDGSYGPQTEQAVLALQKAAGLARDGVLGPRTRSALTAGALPRPRTTSGSAIEIDLGRQLVLVVTGGRLRFVLSTSTGSGQQYTSQGVTSVATTPRGRFAIFRQVDAMDIAPLGELWRPKYFTGGYALHGSTSIPAYPASHGCARISNAAIDMLWSGGLAPIGRPVWVY
jgi:N-acetylmuramoyl-L-alanine amidase